jgi:hypothetical protein
MLAPALSPFAELHTFASAHKDGETWETNGRKFKRVQGKTVRVTSSGDPQQAAPKVASRGKPLWHPKKAPWWASQQPKKPTLAQASRAHLRTKKQYEDAAGRYHIARRLYEAGKIGEDEFRAEERKHNRVARRHVNAAWVLARAVKDRGKDRGQNQTNGPSSGFSEGVAMATQTTRATRVNDPLALQLFAEFGPTARGVVHTFGSSRKEGEKWETAGRYFQRQNGQTVRIAAPDSGQTGQSGGDRGGATVLPPAGDFRVTGGRPSPNPNLDARKSGGRPSRDVTDVRQVRKARTRAEGPEPEAAKAYQSVRKLQAIEADLKSRDPAVSRQAAGVMRDHAANAGARGAATLADVPPESRPTPEAVAGVLGQANAGVPAAERAAPFFGAVERHTTDLLHSLATGDTPEGFAGKVGGWVRGLLAAGPRALVGGLKMLGRVVKWAAPRLGRLALGAGKLGARAVGGVARGLGRAAWGVATSDAVKPFLLWTATMAMCAGFVAAPFLAAHLGMGGWSMLLTPLSVAGVIVTGRRMGRRVADVGLASKGVYLPAP